MRVTELRKLASRLDSEMRRKWDRSLPFPELMSDRWERARSLGFGKEASIHQSSHVYGDVKVGQKTWIGPFTILDGTGGLTIGEFCSISSGVQIYSHDTVKWALTRGRAKYEHTPVTIGDCCHIGSQTVVAKGVRIGDHCVIGAHSFVNEDVPPFSIAVGTPARVIGRVRVSADGTVSLSYTKRRVARGR